MTRFIIMIEKLNKFADLYNQKQLPRYKLTIRNNQPAF